MGKILQRVSFSKSILNIKTIVLVIGFLGVFAFSAEAQYFRSRQSGDWNNPQTWEESSTGTGFWVGPAGPPSSTDETITIMSGHTVTVTADVAVDQTTVVSGGILTINATRVLTIADDQDDSQNELTVAGTLNNNGTIDYEVSTLYNSISISGTLNNFGVISNSILVDQMVFTASGIYDHKFTTTAGEIPLAVWTSGSTIKISSYTTNITPPANIDQDLSNVSIIWATALVTGSNFHLNGQLEFVKNLTVNSVGAGSAALFLTNTISKDVTISGSYTQTAGAVNLTLSGSSNLIVGGNFSVTGGNFRFATTLSGTPTNNIETSGNFTYTGASTNIIRTIGTANVYFKGTAQTATITRAFTGTTNFFIESAGVLDLGASSYLQGGTTSTLTVKAGGKIKVGSSDASGAIQTGTTAGNIRVSGARIFEAGSFIVYNGSAAQFTGSGFPSTGNVNLEVANTFGLTLTGTISVNSGYALNLGTNNNLSIGGQTLNLGGTLPGLGGITTTTASIINVTGSGALPLNLTSGVLGTLLINRSTGADLSNTVTLGNNLTISGALTLSNGLLSMNGKTLTLSGDATASYSSGKLVGSSTSILIIDTNDGNTGTMNFTFDQTNNEARTLQSLSIGRTGGTVTIAGNFRTAASGSIILEDGGLIVTANALTLGNGTVITKTSGTISNGPTAAGTYSINYIGAGNTGPELVTDAGKVQNVIINASGNSVTLSNAMALEGDLYITNGTLNTGNFNVSLKGSIVHTSIDDIVAGSSTFTLNGTAAQSISSSSLNGLTLSNLTINNSSNNPTISTNNITVAGILNFTAGNLITSSRTLTLGPAGSITGETSSKYLIGNIKTTRTVTSAANTYGNIGFTTSGQSLGSTTLLRTSGSAGAVTQNNTGINRKWLVTPGNQPAGNVAVSLSWPDADDNAKDMSALKIYKTLTSGTTEGTIYFPLTTTTQAAVVSNGIRTVTGTVTSFSTLTVSDELNTLPVELTYFNAKLKNSHVELSWQTAMEKNNQGFEVQVSEDAKNFTKIGFVQTKGENSRNVLNYSFLDNNTPKYGVHYYRLKQVDLDGTETFYGPKVINFGEATAQLLAYPNPTNGTFNLNFHTDAKQKVSILVADALGKKVLEKTGEVNAGTNSTEIDLSSLPSGIYIVTLIADNSKQYLKVIKQ